MRWDDLSKGKKAVSLFVIILGAIIIIFLWRYYFVKPANWLIYCYDKYDRKTLTILAATDIVYYGPDIDNYIYEEGEDSHVNDDTNGIICIYVSYSRWDNWKGNNQKNQLGIIGNVERIVHKKTGKELGDDWKPYYEEIDKDYYYNDDDYWEY